MTLSEFQLALLAICKEMASWPPESPTSSVYIRRSEAADKSLDWARRLKKLLDSYSKGKTE